MSISWLYLVLQIILTAQCYFHHYPKIKLSKVNDGDPGKPLFLTPYVESGNITEGRRLARVPLTENWHIKSYAGFFTVNKQYNSNQFFWYFPAMIPNNKDAPVIVWLQGGPGETSLYGLFNENGPLRVRKGKFERRKYTWALNHHIIYIDNPVGTGFSFTKDLNGYCTNETRVGEDLYSTLIQFFQLFPELQKNNFFISGESYAGKYVPSLAYTIHKKNPGAKLKINLRAISIGNGLCDPEHQMVYSKYLYQLGLIDWHQAKVLDDYESRTVNFIQKQQWLEAFQTLDSLLSSVGNMTGLRSFYNYLDSDNDTHSDHFLEVFQNSYVRKAIHVGNLALHTDDIVYSLLMEDFTKSVAPILTELLDHYNVLIYNGQLDVIVAYPLTLNFLRNLKFTGYEEYLSAKRYQWNVDGRLAGYVKQGGRLIEILVRDAGHMVPAYQPKWALDMITRLTHGNTFNTTDAGLAFSKDLKDLNTYFSNKEYY